MGFFRRTPELLSRQREAYEGAGRRRGFPDIASVPLLVIGVAFMIILRFRTVPGFGSKPAQIALVALLAAIVLFGPLLRRRPRPPGVESPHDAPPATRDHLGQPDSPLPKELLDAGIPEQVFERLRNSGGLHAGTSRSFTWSVGSTSGGPIHTEFHETTPDGQTRDAVYDGSVGGGVWRLLKAALRWLLWW